MTRRMVTMAALCLLMICPAFAQEPQSTLPFSVPDTIMVIRVKNINQTIQALMDTVTSFNPMFVPQVQKGVDDMKQEFAGVDFDGAAAIIILDPSKASEPVGVFSLTDAQAFEQGQQPNDPNTVKKAFGKLGLIGDKPEVLDQVIAALKAKNIVSVPTGDMKDMIVMDANVSELMKRYKTEIKNGLNSARAEIKGENVVPPAGAPAPTPAVLTDPQQMMLRAMNHLDVLVDEMERQGGPMQLGLSFNPQEVVMNFETSVVPGTPAAKFFAENNVPANRILAKYLPQDAYVSSVNAFNPASTAGMMDGMVNIATDVFALDVAESAAMHKTVADFSAALTGISGSAEVVHTGAQEAGVMLFGITGKDAARKSFTSMMNLTKSGKLGKLMGDYGVTMNFTERHRDSGGIPVDKMEVVVDFDKVATAMNIPPDQRETFKTKMADMMRKTYGSDKSVVMEIAYGKKLAAVVYGPEIEKRMDTQIELLKSGVGGLADLPEYQAALANQSDKASGVMHFSLFRFNDVLAKMLAGEAGQMMPMNPSQMMPTRAELPPNDQPMTLGVGFNENRMSAKLHVPMQPIRDYVTVVQRKFTQMMMQQMQQPGGGPMPMPMPAPAPAPQGVQPGDLNQP